MIIKINNNIIKLGGSIVGYIPPVPETRFIITVKTDNGGTSASNQFTIPTVGGSYKIETSDGQTISGVSGSYTITFPTAGTYTVKISETFYRIWFNNGGDKLKLLNVSYWGNITWSTMRGAFYGCSNATFTATDTLILPPDCFQMTRDCVSFNQPVSNWNTSSVTIMQQMFLQCAIFNQPLTNWNTSNVYDMSFLFYGAYTFDQQLSHFDTSKVTTFKQMFQGASSFNQSIGNWDTRLVTTMSTMFYGAAAFNQPIGTWQTPRLTTVNLMFAYATNFNQDISDWDVHGITNYVSFMVGKTAADYSTTNLDAIYNKWSLQSLISSRTIDFGSIQYSSAGIAGRLILTSAPNSWIITDGGITP